MAGRQRSGRDEEHPSERERLELWLIEVPADATPVEPAVALLSPDERERAGTFWRPADRARYLVAHAALRLILGDRLEVPPLEVPLERAPCAGCGGPHGKPIVGAGPGPGHPPGRPQTQPVHFSLSHSGSWAMIAVAAVPVGADVEERPREATLRDIGPSLHPREQADVMAAAPGDRTAALGRAWARKEAYLKGIGTGLVRELSADYTGWTGAADHPAGWVLHDVVADDRHAAAVALAAAPATCPAPKAPAPKAPTPPPGTTGPGTALRPYRVGWNAVLSSGRWRRHREQLI
ncbi:4'-phosphopantetheinyl transferase family protein [Streptomyces otsuchiensis]|uniref:4'-phosphopantetheinyl transferase family protein n=1 Tax=Streptomyces otsuchiensis TaxID=2681388 RepID=UPI00102F857D|nr:4'-phosphopantetheinyl transferase superfamily protein [Streptomyces otsuchiensis]